MFSIQDVSFSYRSKKLFSGLDLFLPGGGICGLLGKNGAGKTTLLKLMSGLLFPKKGTIVAGRHTPMHREKQFLESLFFIPEEFILPYVTPQQYMQLYAPFYPQFDPAAYFENLEGFELNIDMNLKECSHGQRKKCLLAFALASNCTLTLLDEPTNGLDIPSKKQLRRLVASALTDDRLFVVATHQVRDLESLIDPVVILDRGKIVFNHTLAEISQHLRVETVEMIKGQAQVLYSEKQINGYRAVLENREESEGFIDLEMLFNAVVETPDNLASTFERGKTL